MIGLINYKAGNSASVMNALNRIEVPAVMINEAQDFEKVSGIILPGVGSAGATMESLGEMGFLPLLQEKVVGKSMPFLGICVGLQVLFEHSEEDDCCCLGWLSGEVKRFAGDVRVPQIGWNQLHKKKEEQLLRGVPDDSYFYFVNSYYAIPADQGVMLGETVYGRPFCAAVSHKNIYATQFHAEKSGETGLQILRNFAGIVRESIC